MATRRNGEVEDRKLTLTEQARRTQLVEVTIELVADNGYAHASLARIAEGAGITKAAVLYHFPSKDALVRAAYERVLGALVDDVAAAVEAAEPGDAPAAYVRAMIGHLREHPRHTRMIIEAIGQTGDDHATERRWRPLAGIIDTAAQARGAKNVDARTVAIITGGAVDAIVAERLHDPDYDTAAAAEHLTAMLDAALSA